MKVYAKGEIKDGKLVIADKDQFLHDISAVPDCQIEIVIKERHKEHKNRRVENLLWAVVLKELAEISGHTEEELYEEYKKKFLQGKSSTELSEAEFNRFFDRIVQHGQHFYGADFKRLHSAV